MRIRIFSSLLLTVFFGSQLTAQIPYSMDFEDGVSKGTRTNTGYPGGNYANNYAEYKINASFEPDTRMLEGEEEVTYFFNTPDSRTSTIVLNLYRNIYKKGVPRTRSCDPGDITDDGVVLESVSVLDGGLETPLQFSIENTKALVTLKSALYSGNKITLKVKWSVSIAATTHHRGGQYSDYSWFVPYWYPQIAVYDDIYGWDMIDHTGNEEFLLEFASYDVNITLGHNMMCWATGELKNMSEIYSPAVMSNYRKAIATDATTPVVYGSLKKTALRRPSNTWHFKADSVPDFVFACSNDMNWSASGLALRPGKPRTVTASVYRSDGFQKCIDMTRKTLVYLSKERPGVVYPYSHMTIFEGSGGMEFPMMINEDYDRNFDSHFFTTSHEVTHSYFPFITGMYQNRYGFMDEGLTQFVPQYFQNKNFSGRDIVNSAKRYVQYTAGSDDNVPVMTPSYSVTDLWIFTVNSYYKPQIAYTTIEDIVGADVMSRILHEFTTAWAGKHPHPYDFFNMCKSISGVDLDEVINSWFFKKGVPDLGIRSLERRRVVIGNEGDMMLPIELTVVYASGKSEVIKRNALVWAGGISEVAIDLPEDAVSARLDSDWIPDINNSNNRKSIN